MMNLCLRYTRNESDAMDALNTGFYKVFKNIHQYNSSRSSIFTWIRTIIINSCIDIAKTNERLRPSEELDNAIDVDIPPDIISKMQSEHILNMVKTLPPATQTVFNLYIMEGYNHKEIGQILKISEGTSKWHLSEARKNLQRMLTEQKVN
jgi:RNA polymerase sigma factor (sigma-70 family)